MCTQQVAPQLHPAFRLTLTTLPTCPCSQAVHLHLSAGPGAHARVSGGAALGGCCALRWWVRRRAAACQAAKQKDALSSKRHAFSMLHFLVNPWPVGRHGRSPLCNAAAGAGSHRSGCLPPLQMLQIILSILFIAIQFSAFIWYCASYIPYGQSFIKRMLGFSSADADDG